MFAHINGNNLFKFPILIFGVLFASLSLSSCQDAIADFNASLGADEILEDRIVRGIFDSTEGEPLDEEPRCDEWFVFYRNVTAFGYTVACAPWFSYDSVYANGQIDVYNPVRVDPVYPRISDTFNSLVITWPDDLDYESASLQGSLDVREVDVSFYAEDPDKNGLFDVEFEVDGETIIDSDVLISLSNSADFGGKIYRMIYNREDNGNRQQFVVFWQQFPS
ncbi:MAG: hypothetical protein ACI959_001408 [Limisphaerales bacterium]|jgi:hypothetical protein